ncbi:MAG TPA: serine/threonine-protein kinase [Nostocaceae cyanobacterium]|nr:serine/threonine-protein kinase [Nostocaceae cyanobacterium]
MEFNLLHGYKGVTPFNHHPDFSSLGYQVICELGRNQEGGRITYLAEHLTSQTKVVIKQFCCANITSDWSDVKAYEREIAILQKLNHPRIPRYVSSLETPNHFYLIQEYKNAPSLGIKRDFQPEEIKQIALSVLEILVYLQQQDLPIIHRDIKPENILVDEKLNAYLVDFGLAKLQDTKIDFSTLVAGTLGFMPPEEQFGYRLTEASDLYSLGATLICLLTNTRSVEISKLIDDKYRFNFQKFSLPISPQFSTWLRKMVERNSKRRYPNAAEALQALKPIQVIGTNSKIDNLWSEIQRLKILTILGIGAIGMLAILITNLMIFQPGNAVKSEESQNYQIQP